MAEAKWLDISASEYREAFSELGASFNFHPDVLEIIENHSGRKIRYLAQVRMGRIEAALPTWPEGIVGSLPVLRAAGSHTIVDVGNGETILPIRRDARVRLPCATDMISHLHEGEIFGLLQSESRWTMIAHGHAAGERTLSSKSRYNRRREIRQLFEAGGRAVDVATLPVQEIVHLYKALHRLRWGKAPVGELHLEELVQRLQPLVRGHALFIDDEPAAFHLLFAYPTPRGFLVKFVSGGMDPRFRKFQPGSCLTYMNVAVMEQRALSAGLQLRFCFGREGAQYKQNLASAYPVFKVGSTAQ